MKDVRAWFFGGARADALEAAFGRADPVHFAWQTAGAYVSERERELVRTAFLPLGERVLDLGCGEGATLVHLGQPAGAVGVDLFEDKLRFARERLPGCRFVRASADELPFGAGAFDHVLVRDLLHHVPEPGRVLAECARVLEPGGRLDVLEPCGLNPLVFAHALARRAERGELRSTRRSLTRAVGRRFDVEAVEHLQAFPLHRLVYHPALGRPALAHHRALRRVVATMERRAEQLVPRVAWAYIHVRARASFS